MATNTPHPSNTSKTVKKKKTARQSSEEILCSLAETTHIAMKETKTLSKLNQIKARAQLEFMEECQSSGLNSSEIAKYIKQALDLAFSKSDTKNIQLYLKMLYDMNINVKSDIALTPNGITTIQKNVQNNISSSPSDVSNDIQELRADLQNRIANMPEEGVELRDTLNGLKQKTVGDEKKKMYRAYKNRGGNEVVI